MRRFVATCSVLAVVVFFGLVAYAQQDKSTRPSPPATAKFDLGGGKSITIDYSSPRAKGRKIFGELVPYGEVWRAGANEATSFVTTADLMIGGQHIPAGKYTLFAIPNKNEWTLVISKKTGEWGIPYPGQADDLARVSMKVGATAGPVENFTIALDKASKGCTLRMEWENTKATVDIGSM